MVYSTLMSQFIRIYQKLDVNEIKKHLMIYGDLGGSCANCQNMDVKIDMANCPSCKTDFQYISFRNIKVHMPKVQRLSEDRPHWKIVDFEDYSRAVGANKAFDFLK